MSYYCDMTINMTDSTQEDVQAIVDYLKNVECDNPTSDNDTEPSFSMDDMSLFIDNSMTRSTGIWGENALDPTPELYKGIAAAAPEADWTMRSYRVNETSGYGQTYLEASYEGHELQYRIMSYVDRFSLGMLIEDAYDVYCDDNPEDSQLDLEEFIDQCDFECFCNYYNPDETVKEVQFDELKAEDVALFCTEDNDVSLTGWWEDFKFTI